MQRKGYCKNVPGIGQFKLTLGHTRVTIYLWLYYYELVFTANASFVLK